jgi:hypothetical protein
LELLAAIKVVIFSRYQRAVDAFFAVWEKMTYPVNDTYYISLPKK